jgi:hypothetical protein
MKFMGNLDASRRMMTAEINGASPWVRTATLDVYAAVEFTKLSRSFSKLQSPST